MGTAPAQPRHPRLTLATTILGSSLAFVDGSVVNVALPDIGRGLHADTAALQWIINAYLLPLSALLLFGGAAGDHYGRRCIFLWGIVIEVARSLHPCVRFKYAMRVQLQQGERAR